MFGPFCADFMIELKTFESKTIRNDLLTVRYAIGALQIATVIHFSAFFC